MKEEHVVNAATFQALKDKYSEDPEMWELMWLVLARADYNSLGIKMPKSLK